ncbi:velvet factor-domain-containing protein [Zychaea mexicana]|uniref:velvet factor-domain-containing protein n=1 Tax=Zychaea mexicana TaxID=64656 RepID=UPI0022FEA985|nr:velvet factor-domain-containing protein [Zychaea mexicana]KAI9484873.1 velvet factor-domain-containing protein [Zychaea mexicana]
MDSQYPATSLPPPAQYYASGAGTTATAPPMPDGLGSSSYMHEPRQRRPSPQQGYEDKDGNNSSSSSSTSSSTEQQPQQQPPAAGGLSGIEAYCGSIGYDEREKRSYELVVCQQPLHARMCGFGEKDRRPIDPPPIVKLIVQQEGQQGPVDVQTLQTPFFVLHVTLWSADREEERNIISNPPKCTRVLMGSLVSSPSLLKNPAGEQGLYFAFPDLSIRTEGRYTLRFSLMKLASSDFQTDAKSKIIAQVFSDPFTVYSAKKFPGMTESTELSKAFAKQGLKIPIRNDGKQLDT